MSAELAARRTAASAALADFHRETDAYIDTDGSRPDFNSWAWRLCTELAVLLDQLERENPDPAAEHLAQVRLVLDSFDWEHDDRQYALEQIDEIMRGNL